MPRPEVRARVAEPIQLTSHPGTELEPSLSPDGQQVAYVWDGAEGNNFDIYTNQLSGGRPLRLTTHPAHDYAPAWSPDGLSLAFLRQVDVERAAVIVIPRPSGTEKIVSEIAAKSWLRWDQPGRSLAWSPDGKWLVAVGRYGPDPIDRVLGIAVATGDTRPLTSPPPKSFGDSGPAISPSGNTLAFSRRTSWSNSELCLLSLSPELMPAGDVQPLATGSPWNADPAWMPDGRTLIFAAGTMHGAHLARIAAVPGASASRLQGAGDYGRHPSIARTAAGRVRLVYTHQFESVNIWQQPLRGAAPAAELITSAHWSYEPDYSRDGKRIAFLSDRSGQPEVWMADANGRNPQQWTFLGKPSLGAPRWSPDGRNIAFTVPGTDGSSIHVVDGPGIAPRLVAGSHRCGYLAWAPDGRVLYFNSNRLGSTQIWKIAPEGGEAVQVTTRGGRAPAVSAEGRYLYYLRMMSTSGEQQLFRIPLTGGEEEKVLDFVDAYSIAGPGIAFKYYRAGGDPPGPGLQFFRFSARSSEAMPNSTKPLRYGIAVDPTGRHVLYSQADYLISDLMLVDGLQ
ncbi:MAG TPA: hypothetical protein VGK29_10855 [Paludibaculum sp.]|jgi:Tol biopolymer transport system component